MSATNATTYYELPVFIATDKPAWLIDWNGAMNAIDTAIKEALTAGENAQITANTATTGIATINDSLTTINTSLTTLTSAVTGLVGSVNTINSLIGNGEPTTSDKTLIGAINEIYDMITGGGGGNEIQAQNVVYDNTTSGLTATDVQSAIDELAGGAGSTYDFDLSAHVDDITFTAETGITLTNNSAHYEFNDDYSIGEILAGLTITGFTSGNINQDLKVATLTIPNLPTRTADKLLFVGAYPSITLTAGACLGNAVVKLVAKTTGVIELIVNNTLADTGLHIAIDLPVVIM